MKIAIYGKTLSQQHLSFAKKLFNYLLKKEIKVIVFHELYNNLSTSISFKANVHPFTNSNDIENVNCLLSIGGDGTLLNAATFVEDKNLPILGINTGRLGFLTSITTENIEDTLDKILAQKYTLDKRSLLNLHIHPPIKSNFALNEITIQKKDTSSMINIKVLLDGEYLNTYWSDGLIISTPTGSTAYSMSCNGPIVLPRSGNIILTPIAPHNLNVRPLVIPDNAELTIKIAGRTANYLVALDTRSFSVHSSEELKIKKSSHYINLIRLEGYDYLDTLRTKLMWGLDKRN